MTSVLCQSFRCHAWHLTLSSCVLRCVYTFFHVRFKADNHSWKCAFVCFNLHVTKYSCAHILKLFFHFVCSSSCGRNSVRAIERRSVSLRFHTGVARAERTVVFIIQQPITQQPIIVLQLFFVHNQTIITGDLQHYNKVHPSSSATL